MRQKLLAIAVACFMITGTFLWSVSCACAHMSELPTLAAVHDCCESQSSCPGHLAQTAISDVVVPAAADRLDSKLLIVSNLQAPQISSMLLQAVADHGQSPGFNRFIPLLSKEKTYLENSTLLI